MSERAGEIPAVVRLAWSGRERQPKGPKPGLTLDAIVAAAIAVADEDGLGALSMARVAATLGASTMSLYRYIDSKDALVVLMVDAALGAPPPRDAGDPSVDWRAGLARWAAHARDAYLRHPWALRVPITAPPITPNNVAWLEDALRCLAATKLTEQSKLSCVLLLSGFVRNTVLLTVDVRAGTRTSPPPSYGLALSQLIDPAQFPAVHRAIVSGSLDDDDEELDSEFDFGLARILDGIDVLVRSSRTSSRRR